MIDWLVQRMEQWKYRSAIVTDKGVVSYGELLEMTNNWQSRLNIMTGQIVLVESDYTLETCSLILALIKCRAVVTFRRDDFHGNPLFLKLDGDPGLIFFTSGSTGQSKAVLHNFSILLEKFKTKGKPMSTITFLLLDHIGGINTLFYTLSSGGTIVIVKNRDPITVCKAIEQHGVELLPTSPTFLNMLLISEAYKKYDLSSLRLITYGTEVMPPMTLQRVGELFPQVRLKQTYGLSELGILHSKSKNSGSLLVKVGGDGFETKMVDGTLWIRGKSAMLGYLNAPSPFDSDGWMNTGDIVEVDAEYIHILGRKSDVINVGGEKVFPTEVESVLLQMPGVIDVLAYQDNNSLLNTVGVKVKLAVPETLLDLKKRIRVFCKDRLAPYKIPVRIEITDQDLFSDRYKKTRM